ncbi:helix-turn-helix domain-containing protein, partial [Actinopolyspora lacussalsi]
MTRLLSPAVYRRMIALELQRMRKAADVTQQEAAVKLGCSRVRINHFESMRNLPRPADVEVLLPHYGATERIEEFRDVITMLKDVPQDSDLARLAEVPRGFDIYLGLEQGRFSTAVGFAEKRVNACQRVRVVGGRNATRGACP